MAEANGAWSGRMAGFVSACLTARSCHHTFSDGTWFNVDLFNSLRKHASRLLAFLPLITRISAYQGDACAPRSRQFSLESRLHRGD